MNKTEIRKKYKALRKELSPETIEIQSLKLANLLIGMPIWDKTYFHLFLPIEEQKEINTEFILHVLAGRDKDVVLSKTHFDSGTLSHFLLTDQTRIQKNAWNIPEPVDGIEVPVSKIDVVFVPLLAFDLQGHRVGYGKGFYDRFLAQCKPETIKIGLSLFEAIPQIEDTNPTDIKLDYCLTPNQIYDFS
jgi:5-formyltetrahydrofolate cyclo-ligase